MRALGFSTTIAFREFEPTYLIHYDSSSAALSKTQALEPINADTLFFTGGHGAHQPTRHMNHIQEDDLKRVFEILRNKNQSGIKNVILDPCFSALSVPLLKSLLDNNAVVYCNVSESRAHLANELFRHYPTYRSLTLGGALFSQVSMMMHQEAVSGLPGPYTYPAIYLKAENRLYFHKEIDPNVRASLIQSGIALQEITDRKEYLDCLLTSTTPIRTKSPEPHCERLNKEWSETAGKPSLDDSALIEKLSALFEDTFKGKRVQAKDYVPILFPIALRYAKPGHDPIQLLAISADAYQPPHPTTDNDDECKTYHDISLILMQNFALNLAISTINKQFGPKPTPTEAERLEMVKALKETVSLVLGDSSKAAYQQVMRTIAENFPQFYPHQQPKSLQRSSMQHFWGAFVQGILLDMALRGLQRVFFNALALPAVGWLAFAWTSVSMGHYYFSRWMKKIAWEGYHQELKSLSPTQGNNRLQAFLDGASETTSSIASTFSYRDWRYMRDYYAGVAAKDQQVDSAIHLAKSRLNIPKPH